MPEDVAPDESPDTPDAPEPSGPDEDGGTPADAPAEINWQQRYENLHPEYTRATQEAAQYRRVIDAARQGDPEALELLGYEAAEPDDDEDEEYVDPDERWEQRFSQIEARLQEQAEKEQRQELQGLEQEWRDHSLAEIEKTHGKLSKKETDAVVNLADRMRDENDIPDYDAAYELLSEAAEANRARYLKSKKSDVVAVGQAGEKEIDMADDDSRVNLLANMIEAGEAD